MAHCMCLTVDRVGYGEGCTSNINASTTNDILRLPSAYELLSASSNYLLK